MHNLKERKLLSREVFTTQSMLPGTIYCSGDSFIAGYRPDRAKDHMATSDAESPSRHPYFVQRAQFAKPAMTAGKMISSPGNWKRYLLIFVVMQVSPS